MATLQKFKLLATQCAVAGSPSRSPTTSPVIHLRRRKTLRMLLSRSSTGRRLPRREENNRGGDEHGDDSQVKRSKELVVSRHKLKDLFVSSPPLDDSEKPGVDVDEDEDERLLPETGSFDGGRGLPWRRGGAGSLRPLSAAFRHRLLRRAWRPVLVTIPE